MKIKNNQLEPYEPTREEPWNFLRVWTLHRRAGYGAAWEEIKRDLNEGPQETISRIFAGTSRSVGLPKNFLSMRKILGDAAVTSQRSQRLIAWWLYQMYFSPKPIQERLATLWHNHFATSNAKVNQLDLMRQQNEIFRELGGGEFSTLLAATLKHPAMLKWLDGDKNRVGRPNENLGRELLELFSLGVGNYSELDVKNASRALTGWTVRLNQFQDRKDWHDADEKTFLGEKGPFGGDDLINIVCAQPATARRIAWRLCDEFLSPNVIDDSLINGLATRLRDQKLNISAAAKTLLQSQVFFSENNMKQKVVDPESFVIGSLRALEVFDPPASTLVLADWVQQLGRKLFYPPNVGGWPGGRAWLNTRTAIARANFGAALSDGRLVNEEVQTDFCELAKKHVNADTLDGIVKHYCLLLTGTANEQQVERLCQSSKVRNNSLQESVRFAIANVVSSPIAQLC